jgi:acyl dehydratase
MPWFEDVGLGTRRQLGDFLFTEAEIIRFATKFDPQYFHIDPVAALDGPYGGLIASGWHTVSIWMKLMVASWGERSAPADASERQPSGGPSPGFLDLRWPTPVRPGDRIVYSTEMVEKIDLKSRPGWGLVRSRNEGVNQRGELVLRFTGQALIERRSPYQPPI